MTTSQRPVQYKGEDLDAERGPGLGCFRFQLVLLAILVVLTPLSVVWQWPDAVSAALLFAVVILLLFTGQTIIFLLRLVAADRRGRRRPLASATKTVGELEDEGATGVPAPAEDQGDPDASAPTEDEGATGVPAPADDAAGSAPVGPDAAVVPPPAIPPSDEGPVRQ